MIRPLLKSDVVHIYGHSFSNSVRGFTAVLDGKIIGIAGVLYTNPLQCFSTIDDKMKEFPRVIVKTVQLIRELLDSFSTPVYAKLNEDEPTAFGFLQHIGFTTVTDEVMVWDKHYHG